MGYQPMACVRMRKNMGNVLILLAGLAVYAGYGISGFVYLGAAVIFSYLAGLMIPRFRWVMWFSAAGNAMMLLAVKLQDAIGAEWISVLGISYFTLKILSYHGDLYRGKYPPETNFFRYALYITYLPQLFLGPIERFDVFSANLGNRHADRDGIWEGAARILWGLFKILVISARAAVAVSSISADPETYRGAYALAAMILYYVQLYTDFSGGVDVIIGVSRMLGIRVSENFRTPYLAETVQEFWRCWHITLGDWLRDYVYIPLGGSRRGHLRRVCNTVVTFLVSGLWHGANYLLWGLLNGVLVLVGGKCKTGSKFFNRLGTFLVISFLWAFFVWPDTVTSLQMILSVFTEFDINGFVGNMLVLGQGMGEWIVLVCGSIALGVYELHREQFDRSFLRCGPASRMAIVCALGLIILVFGMYGIGFEVDAFIYSKF